VSLGDRVTDSVERAVSLNLREVVFVAHLSIKFDVIHLDAVENIIDEVQERCLLHL
jgi:hypothetical protein